MRHRKEVWKQKFKLIFSLCPGFGREGLQLIDWLSIWKYLSKNMWSFVKKIWVAIKWCTLEWFFAFFLISNKVFTLFFCLGLQSYWWKDTFYRTFECLVLKYRDIPSQSFPSIVEGYKVLKIRSVGVFVKLSLHFKYPGRFLRKYIFRLPII